MLSSYSRPLDIALFVTYTIASVAGLILIKSWLPAARALWTDGSILGTPTLLVAVGAGLYIASFAVWLLILARNELSVAYPIAIGLTLAFSTLFAKLLLGETLSPLRLSGIVVIFVGIWLVVNS